MNVTASVPTAVITGSSSGIGRATFELLVSRGWRAVGIDLRGADINADLARAQGRKSVISEIASALPHGFDAFIACAGISARNDASVVSVNYFGVTEVMDGVRPLLAKSPHPRAVAVSSFAAAMPTDAAIVDACLAGDESRALAAATSAVRADPASPIVYTSSKLALARWIKRSAVSAAWAAPGILLNAIAPGTVHTPMVADILADPAKAAMHRAAVPRAVQRVAEPADIARLLAFLAGPENGYIVGQVIFADGGAEATLRPERI